MENEIYFNCLARCDNQTFTITHKKPFSELVELSSYFEPAFNFAFDMTFGQKGHHREYRSGGSKHRTLAELFANTLQGKLAEFAFYAYLAQSDVNIDLPDTTVSAKGIWDEGDFKIKDTRISIKSGAHFASLMLFEKKDWDARGCYLPDGTLYNAFVFCRLQPNAKALLEIA